MIIELFGLPGVGKTQLAKALAKVSGYEEIQVTLPEKIVYFFLFSLLHPLLNIFYIYNIFTHTRKMNGPSLVNICARKLFILYPEAVARQQKAWLKKGIVIVENGLLLLLLSSADVNVSKYLVKKYHKSDIVVIVEVDEKIRKERFTKRGRFPRSSYGKKYHKQWRPILARNNKTIARSVAPKLVFDNKGDLVTSAKKLHKELNSYLV